MRVSLVSKFIPCFRRGESTPNFSSSFFIQFRSQPQVEDAHLSCHPRLRERRQLRSGLEYTRIRKNWAGEHPFHVPPFFLSFLKIFLVDAPRFWLVLTIYMRASQTPGTPVLC